MFKLIDFSKVQNWKRKENRQTKQSSQVAKMKSKQNRYLSLWSLWFGDVTKWTKSLSKSCIFPQFAFLQQGLFPVSASFRICLVKLLYFGMACHYSIAPWYPINPFQGLIGPYRPFSGIDRDEGTKTSFRQKSRLKNQFWRLILSESELWGWYSAKSI